MSLVATIALVAVGLGGDVSGLNLRAGGDSTVRSVAALDSRTVPSSHSDRAAQEGTRDDEPHGHPPFPGSRKIDEILANVREEMKWSGRDKLSGLSLIHTSSAWKVTRILDVRADSPDQDYYVIELDKRDGRPFIDVAIYRDSGRIINVAWVFPAGTREHRIPELSAVAERLKVLYGATNATYYRAKTSFTSPLGFEPLIVAYTAGKRRFFVSSRLDVFEEVGFEQAPAQATPEESDAWYRRLARDYGLIEKGDGYITVRRIRSLDPAAK